MSPFRDRSKQAPVLKAARRRTLSTDLTKKEPGEAGSAETAAIANGICLRGRFIEHGARATRRPVLSGCCMVAARRLDMLLS